MATPGRSTLLQQLQQIALRQDGAGLTDAQLLERFVAEKDEAAFAALLRRHGPMVFGVCRRILRGWHDAEDAYQATFCVLARKAAAIVPREKVGNWLYGVAYRTALEARTILSRRRAKEGHLRDIAAPEAEDESQRQLQSLLDRELNRLPDKYRMPIVFCDLEGMTRKEAARQLGWPEGTVATRLAKARGILRARLTRQGLTLTGFASVSLLSGNGASACVSKTLEVSTIKAATVYAASTSMATGLMSANVAVLTEGVLKGMFLSKIKILAAVLVVVGALGFGAGVKTFGAGKQSADTVLSVSTEHPDNVAAGLKTPPLAGEADQARDVKEISEANPASFAEEEGREIKKKIDKKKRRHEDDEDEDEDDDHEGKKVDKNKRRHTDEGDDDDDDRRESKKKVGKNKREHEDDEDEDGREGRKKAGNKKRQHEDDDDEDDDRRESKKKAEKKKRGHEDDEDDRREGKKKASKKKRKHEEDEDDDRGREGKKKKVSKNKREHEDDEHDGREGKKKAGNKKRQHEDDDRGRESKKKAGKKKRGHEEDEDDEDGREAKKKSDTKKRRYKDD